jgi:hypothetical protein
VDDGNQEQERVDRELGQHDPEEERQELLESFRVGWVRISLDLDLKAKFISRMMIQRQKIINRLSGSFFHYNTVDKRYPQIPIFGPPNLSLGGLACAK